MNHSAPHSHLRGKELALAFAVLAAGPLCGQSLNYGELEALFGESVTTSVTGSPQRASVVPATMLIITAEQIRRSGARDLPDVLQHMTGIDPLRWSNSSVDVGIRGYNKVLSSRVLVLVDGRQVYADHYGYTPWSTLPVEMDEIRQIEVVKGPNSALFGFNATGGVINIVTYNPEFDDIDFVTVRSGTHDYQEISTGVTFDLGTVGSTRISAGARRNNTFITPPGLRGIGQDSGEERNSLRFDARFPLSPSVELQVEGSYSNAAQPIMAPTYTMAYEDMTFRSVRVQLDADTQWGLIGVSVYRNWIDDNVVFPLYGLGSPSDVGSTVADINSQITMVQLQDIFKIGTAHIIRLSGEYRESRMETMPLSGATVSYRVHSGGAMWNWQLGTDLALTNTVRVDHLKLHRDGFIPPPPFAFTNASWDQTIRETSYNIGLVWNARDQDVFRLTMARGAQLPNLYALGGNFFAVPVPGFPGPLFISGLPDLEPTVVSNVELAWDRKFADSGIDLKLALFSGESRKVQADFGRFIPAAGIFNGPANIGSSDVLGFEATLAGRFDDQWHWQLGYIHEEIDDKLMDSQYPQWRTLTNYEDTTPSHIVNANLGWTRQRWELDAFVRYQTAMQGFQPDSQWILDSARTFIGVFDAGPAVAPASLVEVSDYLTLDIRTGWKLSDQTTLSITGRNLLHGDQSQTSGLPVERSILANATFAF